MKAMFETCGTLPNGDCIKEGDVVMYSVRKVKPIEVYKFCKANNWDTKKDLMLYK
jgi:hypothetical protein